MVEVPKETEIAVLLLDKLQQIKAALKTGKLDQLGQLSRDQDKLIARLGHLHGVTPISQLQMQMLKQSAGLNQRLLNAAQAGLRSARRRNSDIHAALETSQTYDRTGHRRDLAPISQALEKRS